MKKYQIIYADPPWRYDFSETNSRKIENQYPTMDLKDISNLIYDFPFEFAKDSVLYLWATAPKLREALELMKDWGFEYKTNAVWDKETIGMGYWFRGQHEILLVGTKGEFPPPNEKDRVSSVIKEKKTKHSKKPNYVRNLISRIYPNNSKIELFARNKTEGWDVWGNEVESAPEIKEILKV